jgi:hypothetical protein
MRHCVVVAFSGAPMKARTEQRWDASNEFSNLELSPKELMLAWITTNFWPLAASMAQHLVAAQTCRQRNSP